MAQVALIPVDTGRVIQVAVMVAPQVLAMEMEAMAGGTSSGDGDGDGSTGGDGNSAMVAVLVVTQVVPDPQVAMAQEWYKYCDGGSGTDGGVQTAKVTDPQVAMAQW